MSKEKSGRKKKKEKKHEKETSDKLSKKILLELADSRFEELKTHMVSSYTLFGKYLHRLEDMIEKKENSKAERLLNNLKILLNVEISNITKKS